VIERARFTIGVFQDAAWARRGIEALLAADFAPESITILGKDGPELTDLIESLLDGHPDRIDMKFIGPVVGRGPLLKALQGEGDGLVSSGLGASIGRIGFLSHDGYIFETLTGRGGVLVALRTVSRAADALAKLHAYGAGNAAIGCVG
jgi:hypothetical protein